MKVMGIETATPLCGAGLAGEDGFIADYGLLRGYSHAEALPSAVEKVLADAEVEGPSLDGIAVSIGPGSFTGLRIGLSLAKGLALGWNTPLIAVPTMDGLMMRIPPMAGWACVLLHARKGEVYRGLYHCAEDQWVREGEFEVVAEAEIVRGLPSDELIFLGEGALKCRTTLEAQIPDARILPASQSMPSGFGIAAKGRELLLAGDIADTDTLSPVYLKRFQGVA